MNDNILTQILLMIMFQIIKISKITKNVSKIYSTFESKMFKIF